MSTPGGGAKPAADADFDRLTWDWYVDKIVQVLVFIGGISAIVFIIGIFVYALIVLRTGHFSGWAGAVALAIGIGIQNFPEGAAVSVPLRREGFSRLKSFWYGQLSGSVEPIAGVIGAAAVFYMRAILPYALAFAAGAMIYVVVEELIPESQLEKNTDLATIGAMVGFSVMMLLDVALG